jgi:hypothetical protein
MTAELDHAEGEPSRDAGSVNPADPDGIMFEKHNSPADDLVTEQMVNAACDAYCSTDGNDFVDFPSMKAALRAVAPLIAERAVIDKGYQDLQAWREGNEIGRAAEREGEQAFRLRVTKRTSRTSEAGKRRDAQLPGCSHKGDAT